MTIAPVKYSLRTNRGIYEHHWANFVRLPRVCRKIHKSRDWQHSITEPYCSSHSMKKSFDAIDACDAPEAPASQSAESVAGFPPVSKPGPFGCSCPRESFTRAKFMQLTCHHGEGYGCTACGGCRNPACSAALSEKHDVR